MSYYEKIVEGELKSPSVFREKYKLYPEYTPERLPHRERQLRELAQRFRGLLASPGKEMLRVVLAGSYGTGKTVTAKVFGSAIVSLAKKKGINLKYVHVNCFKSRTLPQVIHAISSGLGIPLPQRGLSVQELLKGLLEDIERKNIYALIALDEFDYFMVSNSMTNPLYTLVRLYDDYSLEKKRINYLFIVRDQGALELGGEASSSYFVRDIITFPPYRSTEIYDILRDRAQEALYPGVISEEGLSYISILEGYDKGGSGSARTALEILVRAGESADVEKRGSITIDDIRKAQVIVKPETALLQDHLESLETHELLIFLSIIKALKRTEEGFVRMGEVEKIYRQICENYREKARKHTQLYTYIMKMKNMGIISARNSGKGYRGKSTLLGINGGPLDEFEKHTEELLARRGK
ncbi:MAG: ORC1-type DNA replication protein [Fervidicoccaceae archaeon]|jgi:cell division control protein 6